MAAVQNFLSTLPPMVLCLVIGLSITAEAAMTVGMVLPGTTALLLLGFFAHGDYVPLPVALATGVVSAVIGNSWAYTAGRRLGRTARETRWGRRIGSERWAKADGLFARRGRQAVFVGQFVVIARTLVPRVAGINNMPYPAFAAVSLPATIIWAPTFTVAGYTAGASYAQLSATFGKATTDIVIAAALISVCVLTGRWVARHPLPVQAAAHRLSDLPGIRGLPRIARPTTATTPHVNSRSAVLVNLAVTIVAAFGLAALAVLITHHIGTSSGLTALDEPVRRWSAAHQDPRLLGPVLFVISLLRPSIAVLAAAGLAVIGLRRHRQLAGSTVALVAVGGAFVPLLVLASVLELLAPLLDTDAESLFPTQVAVVTCAIALAAALLVAGRNWTTATIVWTVAVTLVLVLAAGRVYTGLSTVTATTTALVLGAAWAALINAARSDPPTRPEVRPHP